MRTLILTCHTGDGHDSAARAIAREYEARGWEYVIADPIGIPTKYGSRFVCSFYNGMIRRTPKAFGVIYNSGHAFSKVRMASPVYAMIRTNLRKLDRFVRKGNFDSVICTHVFGMEAMKGLRRHKEIDLPTFGVFTDYITHPYTRTGMTGYFLPHKGIEADALRKGLEKQKLFYTGIPVDRKFAGELSREDARKYLGISPNKKIVLIMTGGVGCQTMGSLAEKVARAVNPADTQVYVLCGRNEKLAQKIQKDCEELPVFTVPFTKEVHYYMRAADVMLSKAGGLSTTEAAVAGVALVHLKTIPGCESANAKFFAAMGMSRAASTEKQAVQEVLSLLNDPEACQKMRETQRREINPHAARLIADAVARAVEKPKTRNTGTG